MAGSSVDTWARSSPVLLPLFHFMPHDRKFKRYLVYFNGFLARIRRNKRGNQSENTHIRITSICMNCGEMYGKECRDMNRNEEEKMGHDEDKNEE